VRQGWQVVPVSSVQTEEQRHLHRDLGTLSEASIDRAQQLMQCKGLGLNVA
jgi:hypothetical protein